ncbi:DUF2513 domain-containing protein [Oscillibacter sp. GMB15532]|uniref:DUF2513 domain-containing protein n=1 Tax=Oscillibacter sp. GMB15532 TaxID=3230022 RepID=UPI0034DECFB9
MKLDHECVRDVLLAVETCAYGEELRIDTLNIKLPQYSGEELNYTCLKLIEGGLLDAKSTRFYGEPMPEIRINCLTYQGHEFLDIIRENQNWAKPKDVVKKAGISSLKALVEIAQDVAQAANTSALQSL